MLCERKEEAPPASDNDAWREPVVASFMSKAQLLADVREHRTAEPIAGRQDEPLPLLAAQEHPLQDVSLSRVP